LNNNYGDDPNKAVASTATAGAFSRMCAVQEIIAEPLWDNTFGTAVGREARRDELCALLD
jgi:hypothetical protein